MRTKHANVLMALVATAVLLSSCASRVATGSAVSAGTAGAVTTDGGAATPEVGGASGPSGAAGTAATGPTAPEGGPTPGTAECTETRPSGPTAKSRPVVAVTYSSPWINRLAVTANVIVYDDGAVAARDIDSAQQRFGGYSECEIRDLQRQAQALVGLDYGDRSVLDASTTSVSITGEGWPTLSVSVYALGISGDGSTDLTSAQVRSREQLGMFVDALPAGADQSSNAVPTHIRVLANIRSAETSQPATARWPLKPLRR